MSLTNSCKKISSEKGYYNFLSLLKTLLDARIKIAVWLTTNMIDQMLDF